MLPKPFIRPSDAKKVQILPLADILPRHECRSLRQLRSRAEPHLRQMICRHRVQWGQIEEIWPQALRLENLMRGQWDVKAVR